MPSTTAQQTRFKRILVAYDGSDESQHALRLAIELGVGIGAAVTSLVIVPDKSGLETTEEQKVAEAAAGEDLGRDHERYEADAARHGLELVKVVVVGSDPAEALRHYVSVHGFDLLVIGNHGREQVRHGGLGRTIERLLREPPCPLLIASLDPLRR